MTTIEARARRAAEKWFAEEEARHYAAHGLEPPKPMPAVSFTAKQLAKRVDELAAIITAEMTGAEVTALAALREKYPDYFLGITIRQFKDRKAQWIIRAGFDYKAATLAAALDAAMKGKK